MCWNLNTLLLSEVYLIIGLVTMSMSVVYGDLHLTLTESLVSATLHIFCLSRGRAAKTANSNTSIVL